MRGSALRRDHVIAASLAGAVVVVVGYASGIGLRPGGTADAATPPAVADGGHPATPEAPATQPIPAGQPPSGGPVTPLPAIPVGDQPADPVPPMPGTIGVTPAPDPGSLDPGSPPPPPDPPAPSSPTPVTSVPPPPGTDVPACQAGVPQQVLDTVGGLPLLGSVTSGLGVTGPAGIGALVLGYCRAPDGSLTPADAAGVPVHNVLSGR